MSSELKNRQKQTADSRAVDWILTKVYLKIIPLTLLDGSEYAQRRGASPTNVDDSMETRSNHKNWKEMNGKGTFA